MKLSMGDQRTGMVCSTSRVVAGCQPQICVCRVGNLPERAEGEKVDYSSLLHRDGSVFSVVYPQDLNEDE